MATRRRNRTYYNEIKEREPRHLLLKGIRAFNRTTVVLILLWMVFLAGHQARRWALHSPLFELKHIMVRGNDLLAEERILALAGIEARSNLFMINIREIEERLDAEDYIRTAWVERRWPSTINITVAEREPVASLRGERGCVDTEGIFLPPLSSVACSSLPVLVGVDVTGIEYGRRLGAERIGWMVSFLKGAAELNSEGSVRVTKVDISEAANSVVYINGSKVPIRVQGTDCCQRLNILPGVFMDLERKGIVAEYIDIRFENQVVVKPKAHMSMGLESSAVKG